MQPPGYVKLHEEAFEISRKIRYFTKTHCTAFLGLLPASSSHNTLNLQDYQNLVYA